MTMRAHPLAGFQPTGFLRDIKEENLADILEQGKPARLQPEQILFMQGDRATACHLVVRGRLKLTKLHEQGKEGIVRYIASGQVTAAISVFREKEYPVTARALEETEVVSWDRQTIMQLMLQYPGLALNLLEVAVDRLDDIQTRYMEIIAEQVDRRIARALLRIMKHAGEKTLEGIEITFPLSRQELADYTGTTIFTVSRTLSAWEKKGWVKSGREKITVTDPHPLVLFAETG